jgi:hypothetical protein
MRISKKGGELTTAPGGTSCWMRDFLTKALRRWWRAPAPQGAVMGVWWTLLGSLFVLNRSPWCPEPSRPISKLVQIQKTLPFGAWASNHPTSSSFSSHAPQQNTVSTRARIPKPKNFPPKCMWLQNPPSTALKPPSFPVNVWSITRLLEGFRNDPLCDHPKPLPSHSTPILVPTSQSSHLSPLTSRVKKREGACVKSAFTWRCRGKTCAP